MRRSWNIARRVDVGSVCVNRGQSQLTYLFQFVLLGLFANVKWRSHCGPNEHDTYVTRALRTGDKDTPHLFLLFTRRHFPAFRTQRFSGAVHRRVMQ